MNYKVVYFTRTGTNKRLAEKISKKLNCEVVEVTDNMNWQGLFGFIKGGYYASKNKPVEITIHGNFEDADELVVISPLWAGGVSPAIRTFLKGRDLSKIHLVVSSNGSKTKLRESYHTVTDVVRSQKNEDELIEEFAINLLK